MSSDWKTDMAGLERAWLSRLVLTILLVLTVGACGSSLPLPLDAPAGTSASAPEPLPTEDPTQEPEGSFYEEAAPETEPIVEEPYQIEEPPPAAELTPPEPDPEPEDDTMMVIDTGPQDVTSRPASLVEAARAERERRNIAEPTDLVINNESLAEYATGELTVVESSAPVESGPSKAEIEMAEQEAYWREGTREIRQAWRDAYDEIPLLEEKVFQLRQAFYREDDGFYRDGEIKPAWDRAIEQLEQAHLDVEARQKELQEFIAEGRVAGALPGWLREGIDLEPDMTVAPEQTAEPGEPVIYTQEASDPP